MMKSNRRQLATLLVLAILLGGCSRRAKPVRTLPPEPPAAPAAAAADQPRIEPKRETTVLPVLPQDEPAGEDAAKAEFLDDEAGAALLEQALTIYQEALAAMDAGDPDQALGRLDEAYGVILRAQVPADSAICQEKNDLRILIAQRIQQVYALRLPARSGNDGTIPLIENADVLKEIKSFQTGERKQFEAGYKRSGLYREAIVEEFRKAGLPEQLTWLPMIESWFLTRALSRARALGMWQFIASTGYRYGLKRDRYIDERMDPMKASQAAARYLTALHDLFGDWSTALASYNCGEMRVQNVIRAQRIDYLDDFWDLYRNLPYETARFVPRFIAALLIIENPEKYGFTLPAPDPPLDYETVSVRQPVQLAALSQRLGLDSKMLAFFNPELRYDSTPEYDYPLKVPVGYGERVLAALPALPKYVPPDALFTWHTVRRGDTLGALAVRYRTTVAAIARLNNMRQTRMINIGQRLRIPGSGGSAGPAADDPPAPAAGGSVTYTVKAGDTLFQIARQYRTSVDRIKADNKLRSDRLNVGQRLVISRES